MKEYNALLTRNPLFQGIPPGDLPGMLSCLNARVASYDRNASIFLPGDPARWVGIVLEGAVQIVRDDVYGNRTVINQFGAGSLFGESFACAGTDILPVGVTAVTDTRILRLDYRRIITTCSSACGFHHQLVENMLQILASKNILLNQKIEILSTRGIRDKLMAYLLARAAEVGNRSFDIPYGRQELADYLAVDRSALSREMSALQKEGLLRYQKNHFELPDSGLL